MVAGSAGPRLVVIPATTGGQPFAIGKYEVSVADWNHYCTNSGACQSRGGDADRLLPVTGISIQQAEAYVAWLTANTRGTYRIPTDAEWRHAAGADGNPGSSADNNCRVTRGGETIVGLTLRNVNTSSDNGWGVRNHVGNAREWTRGTALQVRGGAHTDSLTSCSVDLVEGHPGTADNVTGFRVARGVDD
jgi:formylglycine-generating enzyme required for sulfatase activity